MRSPAAPNTRNPDGYWLTVRRRSLPTTGSICGHLETAPYNRGPMDINIILEADVSPHEMADIAVAAEEAGIRALWASNYHQFWDAFVALVPAALKTSQLLMGPLAVSPWEMHPLKMANALLTLNELSNGRALIGVSGGGGVLGAINWKIANDAPVWPALNPVKMTRYPNRRVRGVRECIEILNSARSGEMTMGYEGGVFGIPRPFVMNWAKSPGPLIYGCCNGPQMLHMGAKHADGIQFSDFTVDMVEPAIGIINDGLNARDETPPDFRIDNFWAWHIKPDREAAMYEARRELIWRGAIIGREEHILQKFLHDEKELKLVLDNWNNFRKASWSRSGQIDGVPDDIVNRLIAGLSSAGDLNSLDTEIERFRQFRDAGLTELSLRLHDNPLEALQLITEHVLPAVRS
jgi:alkanesulfonate monooxygenase SsuD/methylene tetrahydromethanopterin reductase-like flavin-dependent oxidoreductase (luciferase family)